MSNEALGMVETKGSSVPLKRLTPWLKRQMFPLLAMKKLDQG